MRRKAPFRPVWNCYRWYRAWPKDLLPVNNLVSRFNRLGIIARQGQALTMPGMLARRDIGLALCCLSIVRCVTVSIELMKRWNVQRGCSALRLHSQIALLSAARPVGI